ncbi:hypothetical protein [Paraburkholderia humisilvae]|uniref:Uncharacterized protein n=1 Tax=Paraburkholderia humisilvae TaxID=627669 RepID=A0A6J5DEV6_9BURK|nr:hypothetical protein [Paraburkholderia humisilvae]CAB3751712.1 hypothetical protein LMG29542_01533 [Paraburkholderia humisilvae]
MKIANYAPDTTDSVTWDNFGSFDKLNIKFTYDTTNPPMSVGYLTANATSQLSVTLSVSCYDKNGNPLTGLSGDDLSSALLPVYSDTGEQLELTSEASRSNAGNPLAYVWHGEFSSDNGNYTISYFISAQQTALGTNPKICAVFVPPTNGESPDTPSPVLTIDVMDNAWMYLGSLSALHLSFSDYPTDDSRQICANDQNQIGITVTATCLDALNNPLYQMLPDNLLDVVELIYYDSGNELTWVEDLAPDTDGNPLTYARFLALPAKEVHLTQGQVSIVSTMDGTYSITYYVSAPAKSDGQNSKIAARFSSDSSHTYTTQSGSPYDCSLTVIPCSSPWWNLKSVSALTIEFSDYPSSTSRVINANDEYQVAVTITMVCSDQDGQPLEGPSSSDFLNYISLIYFDSADPVDKSGGNPLIYTDTPVSEHPLFVQAATIQDSPGTFLGMYYVSAPSGSDGTTSKISGKFSPSVQPDTKSSNYLTIKAFASTWWNIGSILELDIKFKENPDASGCTIYANGLNQVPVTVKITVTDQDGNPMTGMDDSLTDAVRLIDYTTGDEIPFTTNPSGDITGNSIVYSNISLTYAHGMFDQSNRPNFAPSISKIGDSNGTYTIVYYISAQTSAAIELGNPNEYPVAAEFTACGVTQTTQSGSGFDKHLQIAVESAKVYKSADFSFSREDAANQVDVTFFNEKGNEHQSTCDVDNWYLSLTDENFYIADADVSYPDQSGCFGIYDHQVGELRNATCVETYKYDQTPTTANVSFMVYHATTYDYSVTAASHAFSVPISKYPEALTFTRITASTNASYYDAGDNYWKHSTCSIHDQYGNHGEIYVHPNKDEDCNSLYINDSPTDP